MRLFTAVLIVLVVNGCRCAHTKQIAKPGASADHTETVTNADSPTGSSTQKRRLITLSNGLKALLISDPNFRKSAAAMDVKIGYTSDPKDHLGLAHLVEHMLFLGTQPFPVVGDYKSFIARGQGTTHALVSVENSSFKFDIDHDSLNEALDMFSAFFYAPLFNEEWIQREKMAVDSEFKKNLDIDRWRRLRILQLAMADHPLGNFPLGDIRSLQNTSRQEVMNFFQTYYDAANMRLVVMSKYSLDRLENWTKKFEKIVGLPKYQAPQFAPNIFAVGNNPRFFQMTSLGDLDNLVLYFPTPSVEGDWKHKSHVIISNILGHEGKGSLLAQLKEKGLVTKTHAAHRDFSFAGYFSLALQLTDAGRKQIPKILEMVFTYAGGLQTDAVPAYTYLEMRQMAQLESRYSERPADKAQAGYYARLMHRLDPLMIDRQANLFFSFDQKALVNLAKTIRPDNMVAIFETRDKWQPPSIVKLPTKWATEEYFGVKYRSGEVTSAFTNKLSELATKSPLVVPEPNPYIPETVDLVGGNDPSSETKRLAMVGASLVTEHDKKYQFPKSFAQLNFHSDKVSESPIAAAKTALLTLLLKRDWNSWLYTLTQAGIEVDLRVSDTGPEVTISGYSPKFTHVVEDFIKRITSPLMASKEDLEVVRQEHIEALENKSLASPFQAALLELRGLKYKHHIFPKSYYDSKAGVDLIKGLTIADLEKWRQTIIDLSFLKSVFYGDINTDHIALMIRGQFENSKRQKIANEKENVKLAGSYHLPIRTRTKNRALALFLQAGRRDMRLVGKIQLLIAAVGSKFAVDIRTKQQMGYVAQSWASFGPTAVGCEFVLQSDRYSMTDMYRETMAWIESAPEKYLDKITDEEFETIRTTLVNRHLLKEQTMSERFQVLKNNYLTLAEVPDYRNRLGQTISEIEFSEVKELAQQLFKESTPKLLVTVDDYASPEWRAPGAQRISDGQKFLADIEFYERGGE